MGQGEVEQTGQELIITDRGKPVLKLVPYAQKTEVILDSLRGSVVRYDDPTEPVGSLAVIVLDTHAWLWWLGAPDQLSETARERIERDLETARICVSSISAWEITMLVKKGRLVLAP